MPVKNSTLRLPESTAIVGCNGAIGAALVAELQSLGVTVHGFDISEQAPGTATATYTLLSARSPEDYVGRFADRMEELRPASLVIASGVYPARMFETESIASLQEVLTINTVIPAMLVKSFIRCTHHESASVVVTSSLAALRARIGTAIYSTSKVALERIMHSLTLEYRHTNVRVNLIRPGYVSSNSSLNPIPETYDAKMKAAGTSSDPVDLVDTYLWLLSDNSRQLNGTATDVDRGMHLGSSSEVAWLD